MNFMTKKIAIDGMTCGHCVMHVEEALKSVCGVKSVKVDIKGKLATVELAHEVDDSKLKEAIEEAGYEVTKVE